MIGGAAGHKMLRRASWLVFVASVTVPAAWARMQLAIFFGVDAVPKCGMPVLVIYAWAFLSSGLLSLIAAGLAGVAYRRLPAPRGVARTAECVLVSVPALVAAVLFIFVMAAA